jgi:hypothetical protein
LHFGSPFYHIGATILALAEKRKVGERRRKFGG